MAKTFVGRGEIKDEIHEWYKVCCVGCGENNLSARSLHTEPSFTPARCLGVILAGGNGLVTSVVIGPVSEAFVVSGSSRSITILFENTNEGHLFPDGCYY